MAIDRFSSRRLAAPVLVLYRLPIALLGFTGPPTLSWIIGWSFVGLAFVLASPIVWTAAVVTEFENSRGKAVGLALTGIGASTTVVFIV